MRFVIFSLLFTTLVLSSLTSFAQDKRTILAVMEIEDAANKFKPEDVQMATDYLRGRLAATGHYVVIDKSRQADALTKTLEESKKESYQECKAKECQIPLGQALSADSILRTGILFLGGVYSIQAELIDLSREATVKGATVDFDEEEGVDPARGLIKALKSLVPQLVGEKPQSVIAPPPITATKPETQPIAAPQPIIAQQPPPKPKPKKVIRRKPKPKQKVPPQAAPMNPRDTAHLVYLGATGVNICVDHDEAKCEGIAPSLSLLAAPGFRFWGRYGIFLDINIGWLNSTDQPKSTAIGSGVARLFPESQSLKIDQISTSSIMPTFRHFTRIWDFFEYYLSIGVGTAEVQATLNNGNSASWKKEGNLKLGWGFMIPISPSLDLGYNLDFIIHSKGDAEICGPLDECKTAEHKMSHLIQSSGALVYHF